LRKDHQSDPDDHGQADAGEEQFAETAGLLTKLVTDVLEFLFRLSSAVDLGKHVEGFLVPVHGRQPAGTSGHEYQTDRGD